MTKVMLADDHAIIRDGLKQILADTEDLVVSAEAANGLELMARLRENLPDIVVLDISMPGKNGIELIKQVLGEFPNVPILVLSMHLEEQYALRALRAGAAGYLTKESDSEILIAAIRKVAAGKMYISSHVAELMAHDFRAPDDSPLHTRLSDREYQVFEMLVLGRGLTEIATSLSLSVKTVSTHKTRILQKMSMTTVAELIRYALANDLANNPN
jgi:two-component system invasion response regulator UvrY